MKDLLRPGETVDLLIPDVLVNYGSGENGNLSVKLADETWLFIPTAMARVTRRVPADGVPQPGDVWRDRFGGVWFARDAGVFVSQENRPFCSWQGVNEDCGPIELLYRPGDDSTPPPSVAGATSPAAATPDIAGGGEEAAGALADGAAASTTVGLGDLIAEKRATNPEFAEAYDRAVEQDPAALDDLGVAVTGAEDVAPIRICSIWPHDAHDGCPGVAGGHGDYGPKADADGDLIAPYAADEVS